MDSDDDVRRWAAEWLGGEYGFDDVIGCVHANTEHWPITRSDAAVAEEVAELRRAFSRNQITAVRDALINFHKTTDIPENRGGPVPPLK